jgi:hypothetical protein
LMVVWVLLLPPLSWLRPHWMICSRP